MPGFYFRIFKNSAGAFHFDRRWSVYSRVSSYFAPTLFTNLTRRRYDKIFRNSFDFTRVSDLLNKEAEERNVVVVFNADENLQEFHFALQKNCPRRLYIVHEINHLISGSFIELISIFNRLLKRAARTNETKVADGERQE